MLMSGISKMPSVLKYPKYFGEDYLPHLKNQLVYVINRYEPDFSILVTMNPKNKEMAVIFGDWDGNNIDLTDKNDVTERCQSFMSKQLVNILNILITIKAAQVQLFVGRYGDESALVDMQTSYNRLSSPGMIRDIFSNACKTQEILGIEYLEEQNYAAARSRQRMYKGEVVIKPSKFRMVEFDGTYNPLYVRLNNA